MEKATVIVVKEYATHLAQQQQQQQHYEQVVPEELHRDILKAASVAENFEQKSSSTLDCITCAHQLLDSNENLLVDESSDIQDDLPASQHLNEQGAMSRFDIEGVYYAELEDDEVEKTYIQMIDAAVRSSLIHQSFTAAPVGGTHEDDPDLSQQ